MPPSVFAFSSYKEFLQAIIKSQTISSGYKMKLAKAMQAPPAFLSQVLHTHIHLTLDHAFKLSLFWNFSSEEFEAPLQFSFGVIAISWQVP